MGTPAPVPAMDSETMGRLACASLSIAAQVHSAAAAAEMAAAMEATRLDLERVRDHRGLLRRLRTEHRFHAQAGRAQSLSPFCK